MFGTPNVAQPWEERSRGLKFVHRELAMYSQRTRTPQGASWAQILPPSGPQSPLTAAVTVTREPTNPPLQLVVVVAVIPAPGWMFVN